MNHYPSAWLQGVSLGEQIAAELRLRIIKGDIPKGTVLSENPLAAEFQTSRAPVRDSLKALSAEGLVRLERMGAVVLGLSANDMEELYDIRFLIENFALQRLVRQAPPALIDALGKIIDKMEIAIRHQDAIDLSYYDLCFHETMIKEAGHRRILHLWSSIRSIVLTALLAATEQRLANEPHDMNRLIEKHRLLVHTLSSQDGQAIEQVLQEHFEDTRRTVHSSIRVWDSTQGG